MVDRGEDARGERCVTVTRTELGLSGRDLKLNNLDVFRRLLADAFDTPQPRCRGIIHLWSLDAPQEVTPVALAVAQELGLVSTLHLVQALAQTGWREPPRAAHSGDGKPRSGI